MIVYVHELEQKIFNLEMYNFLLFLKRLLIIIFTIKELLRSIYINFNMSPLIFLRRQLLFKKKNYLHLNFKKKKFKIYKGITLATELKPQWFTIFCF